MKRKHFAMLTAFVLAAALLLTGCGGSASSSTPAAPAPSGSTPAAPASTGGDAGEPVTIRLIESLTSPERTALLQSFADRYHEAHPNITVEIISPPLENADQKIAQMMQAKQPLDIVEVREQTIQQFINNEWIAPMDSYIDAWDEYDTLTQTTKDYITRFGGGAYYVPYGFYQRALFYRSDWMEDAKLEVPHSWADILDVGTKLTDASQNRYGWTFRGGSGGYFYAEMVLWSYVGYDKLADPYTGSYFLKDGTTIFTTPEAREAMLFYKDLYDKTAPKDSISWGFAEMVQGFIGGTTGMIIQDPEVIATFSTDMEDGTWSYAPVPVGPTGQAIFPNSPAGWGLTSYTEHPDEAMDFLLYLSSAEINTEFAKAYSTIPIHTTAPQMDSYFTEGPFSVYMDMAAEPDVYVYAQSPNTFEAYAEWHATIDQQLQKYLSGAIDVDALLSYMDEYWSNALKEEGQKW